MTEPLLAYAARPMFIFCAVVAVALAIVVIWRSRK